ncbi:MAG: phospho-N-acetylmuramoyl-pentapeptide-transferase [Bacillota bacterium]|nr:phospho-N-acetylmuramoyl-pentapeptide-transferase [Bacillota bacterium]MDK2924850.1 phospho-N-acetylmuramoyl-pentapeptide-transferase [Bacillota bacterium]
MLNRVLAATVLSLALTLTLIPPLISYLRRLKYGQTIRSQGPARHQVKAGTPTMGGVVLIGAVAAATLLFAHGAPDALLALGLTVGYALIGLEDDTRKAVLRRSLGLKAREKLAAQVILAGLLGAWVYLNPGLGDTVRLPFLGTWHLGLWYVPFVIFVVVGAANAVNLTDGLDGLAAGTANIAFLAFAFIAWGQSPGLAVFTAAFAGACLGFLWFNSYPAQIFMGDTGSLALGAGLAATAVLTKTEIWLAVIGGVYVLETLSVIIQVAYFRLTGRRVFRMSPLHHHFELGGWPEPVVVRRFWLAGTAFAAFGLALWYMGA